jgi:hypothetical protein
MNSKNIAPSEKKIQGYKDAINKKVELSNDSFYLIGYKKGIEKLNSKK